MLQAKGFTKQLAASFSGGGEMVTVTHPGRLQRAPPAPSPRCAQETSGPADASGHTLAIARAVNEIDSPFQRHFKQIPALYSEDSRLSGSPET